jgi:hypothetical protein
VSTSGVRRIAVVAGPSLAILVSDHVTISLTYTGHETGRNSLPKGKINNG